MTDEEEFVASGLNAADEGDTWDQKKMLFEKKENLTPFEKLRNRFMRFLNRLVPYQKIIVTGYVVIISGLVVLLLANIGKDVLPKVNSGYFQVRLRVAEGTRIERTELKLVEMVKILEELVGKENISVTSSYVGQHPGQFSSSPIYLFMSGPQEAVLQVNLKEDYDENLEELKERLRKKIKEVMPEVQ